MSGRHPFSELTREFPPERRRRIVDTKKELHRALTQQELAQMLKVDQPAISKLEQRADVYISSLRSYIEAVGGSLKIVADLPEGEAAITNFADLGRTKVPRSGSRNAAS